MLACSSHVVLDFLVVVVVVVYQGDPDLHLPAVLAAHQCLPLLLGLRLRRTGINQVGLQWKRQCVRTPLVLWAGL